MTTNSYDKMRNKNVQHKMTMKADSELVLIILFFFAGWATSAYANEHQSSIKWHDIFNTAIAAIATFLAAFYGARYAFQLQIEKESSAKTEDEINRINWILVCLVKQINFISDTYAKHFYEYEKIDHRELEIRPTTAKIHFDHFKFELSIASFFCRHNKTQSIIELDISQQRLEIAIQNFNDMNNSILTTLQPAIEKISNNGYFKVTELQNQLGARTYALHKSMVDNAYLSLSYSYHYSMYVFKEVRKLAKEVYKNEIFVDFIPDDKTPVPPELEKS